MSKAALSPWRQRQLIFVPLVQTRRETFHLLLILEIYFHINRYNVEKGILYS